MPSSYWSYAILTAMHLINLLPKFVLAFHSPWNKLYSFSPDLSQLKVFGCACYPHLRPYIPHKLAPRSTECIFLGYPIGTKGYLCLDLTTKHLYTSRHVIFKESKFPFSLLTNSSPPTSSPPFSFDLSWFSNLLYLHSTNQPSILGPYAINTPYSSTMSTTTTSDLNPLLPSLTSSTSSSPSTTLPTLPS